MLRRGLFQKTLHVADRRMLRFDVLNQTTNQVLPNLVRFVGDEFRHGGANVRPAISDKTVSAADDYGFAP